MKNTEKPVQKLLPTKYNSKAKTRYIVTLEYTGDLSMRTAFKEVIENQVMGSFKKWKDEKLTN